MKINGSEILVECLKEQGVDVIFGYPGGSVLNIYDALYKHRDEIKHYLTSHEQGAAHAADGYARATGKVGVCLATSGPGATNLVTGIATAYMDSVPIVAITGNVSVPLLGKDSFQEVDIAGITMPITKHNFIVKDVKELADTIRRAFYIAAEGRPGPVLVDIPKDVTAAVCDYEFQAPQPPVQAKRKRNRVRTRDLEHAAQLIMNSVRPLIYGGGGIIMANAAPELVHFVEKIDAPICLSAMGLGGYPASNERFTGMIGMHGTVTSNVAATECDLLIAVGARFSDRVISNVKRFAPNARILHIDIDPAEINKNVVAYHSVIGDTKEILSRLSCALEPQRHSEWMERIKTLKKDHPLKYVKDGTLKPQYIIERIGELAGPDAIITTEVGQHQMWACQYIKYEKPRHFITSGGLGTMGYGLGASIGASIGCPDKVVFNIAGDGCFRMNNIELGTAVEYNVPVIIVIINNHALGMVRQWQNMFYDKRYSHTTLNKTTNFVKLAEAYQAEAFQITRPEEVDEVIKKAMSLKKTVVINCEVTSDEKVLPMVPTGAGIDEMVTEDMND